MRLSSRIRHSAPVAVLAVLSTPPILSAAPAEPAASGRTEFEEEIVVSASVVEEEPRDLAATSHVIDAEEIEARGQTLVEELLASVPGVHVVTLGFAGQQTSVFVRGTESDHVLVLWNGVPLNDPFFGGFNWAFLPTEGVERIEVVPGPFSALYGSDAAGGVVQVVTDPEPGVRLDLEVGEHESVRGALAASARFDALDAEVTGHLRRGEGRFANEFFDSDELTTRLHRNWRDRLDVGLVARWNDSETGVPFAGGRATPERRIEWRELQASVPVRLTGRRWEAEALLSGIDYDSRFSDPLDPSGLTGSETDSSARRARIAASRHLDGEGWVAIGADWERLEASNRSSFGVTLDGDRQRTTAVFSQLHLEGRRWSAEAGLRHDDNDVYGGHTSPRLGFVWSPTTSSRLRASYGQAFRAPSLGELFFPGSGNPELEPESSESYEIGGEIAFDVGDDRVATELTLFRTELDELIDFDFATFRNVNLGRAETEGAELAVRYESDLASARLAASRIEATNLDTGEPLLRRPEEQAHLVVSVRPGELVLAAAVSHVGSRPDIDPATFERRTNPSYTTADLNLRWRRSDHLVPYVRIENVSDERYEEALGFPAPGRRTALGATLSW